MTARATWKGYLKLGEVVSAVALYTAVSASERVSLNMVNKRTGHRLQRRFVDPQTGEEVEREAQVKGYEVGTDEYIVLDPDEIAAATPQGDETLSIDSFIPCGAVDDLYFDRPYYLRPADEVSAGSFAVIREGLRRRKVAALATGVLFRRPRSLLIRAYDSGIVATTLNYEYEVRSATEAFEDITEVRIEGEMLDLARHIIDTKAGTFRPETFVDRYDAALAELVRAKIEGRAMKPPKEPARGKVVDLMEALRRSAGVGDAKDAPAGGKGSAPAAKSPRKKPAGTSTPATSRSSGARGGSRRAPARKAG